MSEPPLPEVVHTSGRPMHDFMPGLGQVAAVECDGLCITSADVGVPVWDDNGLLIAYPHPGCPLHAPGEKCGCGMPERCNSPTHSDEQERP